MPLDTVAAALGGGWWPGLHVLVGNPGSGKSQFALQMALHAARKCVPVLYIGLELGKVDLVARLLGLLEAETNGSCRWSDLYLGKDPNLERIAAEHGPLLRKLPFHLALPSSSGWKYTALSPLAHSMDRRYSGEGEHRPMLVVIDSLQLVAGEERELRERIGRTAYAARAVAQELDAAVLLVSHTARENYPVLEEEPGPGRGNPGRLVGIGEGSDEVEEGADSVLVLCREPWPDNRPPGEETHVWLAVAKQRVGPPTWVELRFNGSYFFKPASGPMVTL